MQGVSSFSLGFYPNLKLSLGLQRAFLLRFYQSQFWRLQKLSILITFKALGFIGHNFGDYKNLLKIEYLFKPFYRSQFWRLQKPQMVSANYTIKVRSYSA